MVCSILIKILKIQVLWDMMPEEEVDTDDNLSLGLKQLGHEDHHSFPSSGQFKNDCSCTSTPSLCLNGVDNSTFSSTSALPFDAESPRVLRALVMK